MPFTVSRLMEFCTRRELVNQTGHDSVRMAVVVLKELVDNALDDCRGSRDRAGHFDRREGQHRSSSRTTAPAFRRRPSRRSSTTASACRRGKPTSRRPWRAGQRTQDHPADGLRAQRAPRRGGFRQDHHRGARLAHHIAFAVDHIRQEPKIEHTTKPSSVVRGTRITVELPAFQYYERHESTSLRTAKTISCNSPKAMRGSIRI